MTLLSNLSGDFDFDDLKRLKFPVAWSGTKDQEEADKEEEELHDFVREAEAALREAYDYREDDVDYKIRVKDGEIIEIVLA